MEVGGVRKLDCNNADLRTDPTVVLVLDCVTWVFYLWRHQNAPAWAPATVFLLPLYKTHCVTKSFLPSGGKKVEGDGAEKSDGIQRHGYKLY